MVHYVLTGNAYAQARFVLFQPSSLHCKIECRLRLASRYDVMCVTLFSLSVIGTDHRHQIAALAFSTALIGLQALPGDVHGQFMHYTVHWNCEMAIGHNCELSQPESKLGRPASL